MSASPSGPEAPAAPPPWPRPVAWVLLQLLLLLLFLLSAAWGGMALLLYPLLPAATGRRLGRTVASRGYGLYWRITAASGLLYVKAEALDALRDEPGLMLVANHPSLLDAMMLVAHLPQCACVMKASILSNPLLGPGAMLARYIDNTSAWNMVQGAVSELKEGRQLVLFPEGTRTTRLPINPFHGSFTLIAKRAHAPIQTVFIDTVSPYLGKGWALWKMPPLPIHFAVRLGRRFEPADDHEALHREIEAYFAAGVRTAAPAQ